MKLALLFLFVLSAIWSSPYLLKAQPSIEWQACPSVLHGLGFTGNHLLQTTDGGYIFLGQSYLSTDSMAVTITKLDHSGTVVWQKQYMNSGHNNYVSSIIQTDDGGFLFAGSTDSSKGASKIHGRTDAWVTKITASGAVQWQYCYGGSNFESINSIVQTRTGESPEYVFAATTNSIDGDVTGDHIIPIANDPSVDAWIVKLNVQGSIIWQKCIGGSKVDKPYQIIRSSTGGLLFAGWTSSIDGDISSNPGGLNMWLVALKDSTILWQNCYPTLNGGACYSLCETMDGGYVLAGETDANDVNPNDAGVVKVDSSGTEQWRQSYGGSSYDGLYYISPTTDTGAIAIGYTVSTDGPLSARTDPYTYDIWIIKYASNGTIQWNSLYGGSMDDQGRSIFQTSDGGYVFAAYIRSHDGDIKVDSPGSGWVVKLKNTSDVHRALATGRGISIPSVISDHLPVSYYSSKPAEAILEVLTVTGDRLVQISDRSTAIGEREITLNLNQVSSGIYFLKIQNSDEVVYRKFIKE